jgi:hypothetical protein
MSVSLRNGLYPKTGTFKGSRSNSYAAVTVLIFAIVAIMHLVRIIQG